MGKSKRNSTETFETIQKKWYERAENSGFNDIEDTSRNDRPLKSWSGKSLTLHTSDAGPDIEFSPDYLLDEIASTEPLTRLKTSFPEPIYRQEEMFLDHPEFKNICIAICNHGNSKFTIEILINIWIDYCAGQSVRIIGEKYKIHYSQVSRAINKIDEWMYFLGSNMENPKIASVILRKYEEGRDAALVYSTWRNSLWYDKKLEQARADAFYRFMNKKIKKILSNPKTEVKVACLSDDPDLIIGYSVMTGSIIEWVYVKKDYRTKGVGRLLTKGFTLVAFPETRIGSSIVKLKSLKIKENKYEQKDANELIREPAGNRKAA